MTDLVDLIEGALDKAVEELRTQRGSGAEAEVAAAIAAFLKALPETVTGEFTTEEIALAVEEAAR